MGYPMGAGVSPPVTLRSLRAAYPHRFYPQDWFDGEAFLDTPLPNAPRNVPSSVATSYAPADGMDLPLAVELAWAYLLVPGAPCWSRYLWCADTDRHGQRIYLGDNGRGLEIHRHLHLTSRWGIARWA